MKVKYIGESDHSDKRLAEFSKAELKLLYNALMIDLLSDGEQDERKAKLLEKLDQQIEKAIN